MKRGQHPNSRKNLVAPWPKGVSGNRGGRPSDEAGRICREIIERNAEAIYYGMARALLKGNAYLFQVLADRGYGKVKETITHERSEPVTLDIKAVDARILEIVKRGRAS